MRILFASTRSAGHFNPLVPFAHACLRAGHDVLMSAPEPCREHAERARLPFAAHGIADPAELAEFRGRVRALPLDEQNRAVLSEMFAGIHARAALPGLLRNARAFGADAIVRETCEFASVVVSEQLGIPRREVAIFLAAAGGADWGDLGPALRRLGVREPSRRRRSYLTLAPPSLDPSPHALRFRAPAVEASGGPPLVYVSFGSIAAGAGFFPGLYRRAIDALAGLGVPLLVTVGNERDPAGGPVPEHVRVERWVSQGSIDARAMVGHGGSGSTLAALAAGIPLALVPLFADQPHNASRVAELGAGIVLEPSLDGLAEAVGALLREPAYARAAREVADEIAALAPVDLAPQLIGEDHRLDAVA